MSMISERFFIIDFICHFNWTPWGTQNNLIGYFTLWKESRIFTTSQFVLRIESMVLKFTKSVCVSKFIKHCVLVIRKWALLSCAILWFLWIDFELSAHFDVAEFPINTSNVIYENLAGHQRFYLQSDNDQLHFGLLIH